MTSRRSSGSSRDERAVEPIRSQNITLSGRRSAVVSAERRVPVGLAGESGEDRTRSSASMVWERKAAIASNRRRRWRIELTPMSLSSSAVSVGKTSASTSFSRNAASYWSRPRLFSHPPTSTAVSSGLVMLAAEHRADESPTSRQEAQVSVVHGSGRCGLVFRQSMLELADQRQHPLTEEAHLVLKVQEAAQD